MMSESLPGDLQRPSARTELVGMIEAATGRESIVRTSVPGLSLSWITSPLPPTSYLYGPSLCVCVRGMKRIDLGGRTFVHPANRILLTAIEMPTIISIESATPGDPYIGLQVDLNLEIARQVIAEIELNHIETPHGDACMAIDELTEPLLDAVVRLVRLVESPQDIPVLSGLIQREILYRIAAGPNGERLRQIVRLGSPSHRIAKAIAWLRDHYTEKLRIEQLSDQAGMGISTLHRHFQQLTTMSPIQYQKHLRLHEARRLLLSEEVDAASAAVRVGYESVSQFNREYRRLFGEPPMRDIKGLKLGRAA